MAQTFRMLVLCFRFRLHQSEFDVGVLLCRMHEPRIEVDSLKLKVERKVVSNECRFRTSVIPLVQIRP